MKTHLTKALEVIKTPYFGSRTNIIFTFCNKNLQNVIKSAYILLKCNIFFFFSIAEKKQPTKTKHKTCKLHWRDECVHTRIFYFNR